SRDDRPVLASRDQKRADLRQEVGLGEAGLLRQELVFVIVADEKSRTGQPLAELIARHARALLAWIEDERDPHRAPLVRVPNHGGGIVRRNDRELAIGHIAERQLSSIRHGTGVERRDLIVVLVGAAEERRGELARYLLHLRRVDADGIQPGAVLAEILAGG